MNHTASRSFNDFLLERLKAPEEARMYLEVAIEEYGQDNNHEAFLLAVKDVVLAQGGVEKLALQAGLNPEYLHQALYESETPHFGAITRIVQGLGFRLLVGKQAV